MTGYFVTSVLLATMMPGNPFPPVAQQEVHVVIVVSNRIGGSESDIDNVQGIFDSRVFRELNRLASVSKTTLRQQGTRGEKAKVLDLLRGIDCDPDDAVFFYYSGHGSVDQNTGEYGLDLDSHERISRSEIRSAMATLHCRLKVLITDTSAVAVERSPKAVDTKDGEDTGSAVSMATRGGSSRSRAVNSDERLAANVRQLFLKPRGCVDIQGCTSPEAAWADGEGGLFTAAFCKCLKTLALDENEEVPWTQVFNQTKRDTHAAYRKMRKGLLEKSINLTENYMLRQQPRQTPIAFSLPLVEVPR